MSTGARLSQAMALVVALVSTPRAVSFVGVGSTARMRNIGFESRAADRLHGVGERAVRSGFATGRRRRDSRSLAMATVDEEEAIRAAALANVSETRQTSGTSRVIMCKLPRTPHILNLPTAAEHTHTWSQRAPRRAPYTLSSSVQSVPGVPLSAVAAWCWYRSRDDNYNAKHVASY